MRGVADLAERYGNGDVRVTTGQNLIVANVPESKVGALADEPLFKELPYDPSPIMRGLVCLYRQRLLRPGQTFATGDRKARLPMSRSSGDGAESANDPAHQQQGPDRQGQAPRGQPDRPAG